MDEYPDDPYLEGYYYFYSKHRSHRRLSDWNYEFVRIKRITKNNSTYVILLDNSARNSRICDTYGESYFAIINSFI